MGSIPLLRKWLLSSVTLGLATALGGSGSWADGSSPSSAAQKVHDDEIKLISSWSRYVPGWLQRRSSTIPSSHYVVDDLSARPSDGGVASPAADIFVEERTTDITLSGYVKGDFIYDTAHDLGDDFNYAALLQGPKEGHTRLHGRQSRLRVQARTESAVGEVRALIEGDFFGGTSAEPEFHLRHAWGEWEMVRGISFGAGKYWRNFMSPFTGIPTVDHNGPAGLVGSQRNAQIRLTHSSGPLEFAISAEDPAILGTKTLPDLSARLQYMLPGGSSVMVSGMGRYLSAPKQTLLRESTIGWGAQAAANLNLGVMVLSASVMYGDGLGNYLMGGDSAAWLRESGQIHLIPAFGAFGGARFNMTDHTSINFGVGYAKPSSKSASERAIYDNSVGRPLSTYTKEVMSVHANLLWEPVDQVRLGWEVIWGQRKYLDGATPTVDRKASDIRGQFGAWFFF